MQSVTPKYIIYWCVCRYLNEPQVKALRDDLGKSFNQQKKFVQNLQKYIDIERLRTHPVHPLDILVYNYVLYEFKSRIIKSKLLIRYYKEVMMASK